MDDDALNGITALGIGVYLLAVVYQGNMPSLLDQLWSDRGYVEFLLAVLIIRAIVKNDPTSFAKPLFALGIFAALLQYSGRVDFLAAMRDFGSGRKTLFQTLSKMTGN